MEKIHHMFRRAAAGILGIAVFGATLFGGSFTALADTETEGTATIDTSVTKPTTESEGAVLYDATDGIFLYEKNADTQFYPASITKVMTALLAAENLSMDDTVTFSSTAVNSIESGGVTLGIEAGDTFKVSDLMYGLWLHSANEVANGLAEKISGSISAFCDMMNEKAVSLGCTNTNFENPNGLNNSEHKTTPHDMALITAAAFENKTVRTVAGTLHYTFPASEHSNAVYLTMGHKMLNPSSSYYYEGFIGGKTGYTSKALNTLVSVAERDGIRLVAVVMKSNWKHYSDTKALFDYGFSVVKSSSKAYSLSSDVYSSLEGVNAGSSSSVSSSSKSTAAVGPGSSSVSQTTEAQGPGSETAAATISAASPSAKAPASAALDGKWIAEGNRWRFLMTDGNYAASGIYEINGDCYGFGSDTYMLTGWQQIDGKWYYFSHSSGAIRRNYWVRSAVNEKRWYYLGSDGAMMTNATTPDGYQVDSEGAWEES